MKTKRSLGQNFLTSKDIAEALADSISVEEKDTVVEIGPGRGMITEILLKKAGHVIAGEKDGALYENLKEKFAEEIRSKRLILIHDDILNFNPITYNLKPNTYKLLGSIPYNITSLLFRKFLEESSQPSHIAFIVQREVAERIVAREGRESMLSISIKVYGTPRLVRKIHAGSFFPKPNVDSAILLIENISKKNFSALSEKRFFQILHAGFSHPRKKLSSNLKSIVPSEKITDVFNTCEIPKDIRAEKLSVENWLCLAEALA